MIVQSGNKAPKHVHLPYDGNGYQFEAQEVVNCLLAGETESKVASFRQFEFDAHDGSNT